MDGEEEEFLIKAKYFFQIRRCEKTVDLRIRGDKVSKVGDSVKFVCNDLTSVRKVIAKRSFGSLGDCLKTFHFKTIMPHASTAAEAEIEFINMRTFGTRMSLGIDAFVLEGYGEPTVAKPKFQFQAPQLRPIVKDLNAGLNGRRSSTGDTSEQELRPIVKDLNAGPTVAKPKFQFQAPQLRPIVKDSNSGPNGRRSSTGDTSEQELRPIVKDLNPGLNGRRSSTGDTSEQELRPIVKDSNAGPNPEQGQNRKRRAPTTTTSSGGASDQRIIVESPTIEPKQAKLEMIQFHVGNWLSCGSVAVTAVVKNHLVMDPFFKNGKMVLSVHSTGEHAILDLMEKYPLLDITVSVGISSSESVEASGVCSGFASSRKVSMDDLEEEQNEFSYLHHDVQNKSVTEKAYANAMLMGDYIDNSDSELDMEEGRSEIDYFRLSSSEFSSSYSSDVDNMDQSVSNEDSVREEFEKTKKSLEETVADKLEASTGDLEESVSNRAAKHLSPGTFGIDSSVEIPSFEESYPTYWIGDRYVKSFISEGGWLSKDLYLMRGLENETFAEKSVIHFMYKGNRISTKARFQNDENKDKPHKDVKCFFNPKCEFNNKPRSVRELQKHHYAKHREEFRDLNRPIDPVVLNFAGEGWFIYVHCGSCNKMPLFGWQRHITVSNCLLKTSKWNCLNVEYHIARKQIQDFEMCKRSDIFFDICTAAGQFENMRNNFEKAVKVDLKVRKNMKWIESGENKSSYQHKYYALLSKSLKKLYIGSTGRTLGWRFYRHSLVDSDAYEILCQDDCLVTMFAIVEKAKILTRYDEVKAFLEYYFVNTVKLQEGWTFVNAVIRPDIC